MKTKKYKLWIAISLFIISILLIVQANAFGTSNTQNPDLEYSTLGTYNNRTGYTPAISPTNISTTIINTFKGTANLGFYDSSPVIGNGYLYIGEFNYTGTTSAGLPPPYVYQLNASNISQMINKVSLLCPAGEGLYYNGGGGFRGGGSISGNFVYFADKCGYLYKLNASNISKSYLFFNTSAASSYDRTICINYQCPFMRQPMVIYNESIFIANSDGTIFKINASDMTLQANYSTGNTQSGELSEWNGNIYVSLYNPKNVTLMFNYSLNLKAEFNMSQKGYATGGSVATPDGVYVPTTAGYNPASGGIMYRLNLTTLSLIDTFMSGGNGYINFAPSYYQSMLYLCWYNVTDAKGWVFQINATNLSQTINKYNIPNGYCTGKPSINDKYVFFTDSLNDLVYQVDNRNISRIYTKYNISGGNEVINGGTIPVIAGGYLYVVGNNKSITQFGVQTFKGCVYPGDYSDGRFYNWTYDCSQNCTLTSDVYMKNNTLTLLSTNGNGSLTVLSNLTVDRIEKQIGCKIKTKIGDGNYIYVRINNLV